MEAPQNDTGNDNETTSPLQKVLIGGATLIVVILTVVAAAFLAMQESPTDETTPVAQISPTVTNTVDTLAPTSTSTPVPPPSETPLETATATPSETSQVPPTEVPATDTPAPVPPTFTPSPVVVELPTDTPVPPPPPPTQAPEGGICQPPADWVTHNVEVGDTLNTLSKRTNTTVFDLQQVNCLETFTIMPGDIIYLPYAPPTPTVTSTPTATGTRKPTPVRTSTPIAPRIQDALVRVNEEVVSVFVTGENFQSRSQGFRAELVGLTTILLELGEARTTTSFEAYAPVEELQLGTYDLVVINPDGQLGKRENVWPKSDSTPVPTPLPPEIIQVSPSSGEIDKDVRLTVQGRNFQPLEPGFRVELRLDDGSLTVEIPVDEGVRPATNTSFDALILAGSLETGLYDLLVTNPDGQTDIDRSAYDALP